MADKETNRRVGSMEEAIRNDAARTAGIAFHNQFRALFNNAHAYTWTKNFTYDDWKALERLADKYKNFIAIPLAEEAAIKQFLGTYEKLAIEFPSLMEAMAEGAYEDGKHDGRDG